ncbi:MAG: hypothetical protein H6712_08685 [Myxococcales bacterium]|nr:hypothetical protein [Myxococcales bacterium]MCB9713916.1 hypothetical protein [Myxococcales bacterium]
MGEAAEAETVHLTERQERILRAVCRDFVVYGQEVGSSALVRRHGFRWSSATLRQELAVLEALGLLRRPHRSAGCSPTDDGMRRFVAQLDRSLGPQPALVSAVDRSLEHLRDDPGRGMRAAVCVLSEVSGCLAVSFLGTAKAGRMEQVDVVPLVGARALVVLTLEGGASQIQPVELELPEGADAGAELRRLQERLRRLCVGHSLPSAREVLLARLGEREAQVDRLLAQALRVGLSLCAVSLLDPLWMQVAGQPALARGVSDTGSLGEVLSLLEDDQRLAEVLEQLLPATGDGPPRAQVHVGVRGRLDLRPPDDGGRELGLSLVGCRVPVAGEGPDRGAVALLGPARMDYAAMIPLVEYAARAMAARMCA